MPLARAMASSSSCARTTQSTGPKACPFTTLYWDYLLQHEPKLRQNQRMSMQLKNLTRLSVSDREKIQKQANLFRVSCQS